MDIILQGQQEGEKAIEQLLSVVRLFKERYDIEQFREIHLTISLVNQFGEEVELVDSESGQTYRVVEVHQSGYELKTEGRSRPLLQLVIDNTRQSKKD